MTIFRRVKCVKTQPNGTDNRITVEWLDPFGVWQSYMVNQNTLNRFSTPEELKAALDDFTMKTWGYTIPDVWFHKNRDGSWAMATGANPPAVWPEDETHL